MEKLEAEVKRLRKQVNFLLGIAGALLVIVLFRVFFPSWGRIDPQRFSMYTDSLTTQAVTLVDRNGVTQGRLTGDRLAFYAAPGEEGHSISTAVNVGVDDQRQPDLGLSFHVKGETPRGAKTASMHVGRDYSDGTPRASFFDADGRDIPWNADR